MRRVGVLSGSAPDDPDAQARLAALRQGLQQLGWIEGRNLQIDARWGAGDAAETRKAATELAALAPDVIVPSGSAGAGAVLQATRTVPTVFVIVPDPVGSGFVESLAQPGGNATGFMMFEYGLSAKWLELLKEIAPGVTRAAVLRDPALTAGIGQFAVIQSAAPSVGVDVSAINLRDAAEIERAVTAFARRPNGGLILTTGLISSTSSGARLPTSIAFSRARSRPICRCRHRPSTSWSSTSRPQRRLSLKFRLLCSPAPTR
jgi:putative ABC transport system substrate-binding protein